GVTDRERVRELVAKRSRALLDARAAEIALLEGDEFLIAAVAGEGVSGLAGERVPIQGSLAGAALHADAPRRFDPIPPDTFAARELHARTAIVTPMLFRSRPVGFLLVLDRSGGRPFSDEDARLLEAFAAGAATAVATAQTAGDEALRRAIEASEAERGRWARELHDETLQQLAGLRVLLSGARRSGDAQRIETAVGEALDLIGTGIADLRGLIADLRPAALDELGVHAALESLTARVAQQTGLEIGLEQEGCRPGKGIESTIYRLVQEGLTNVVKHADARRVLVRVRQEGDTVEIRLSDDGRGFGPQEPTSGFGLVGMHERVALVRGALVVESR